MKNLNKEELLDLIYAYDRYIQDNAENNESFGTDWMPVCINEFYDNEYQQEEE